MFFLFPLFLYLFIPVQLFLSCLFHLSFNSFLSFFLCPALLILSLFSLFQPFFLSFFRCSALIILSHSSLFQLFSCLSFPCSALLILSLFFSCSTLFLRPCLLSFPFQNFFPCIFYPVSTLSLSLFFLFLFFPCLSFTCFHSFPVSLSAYSLSRLLWFPVWSDRVDWNVVFIQLCYPTE